MARPGDGTELKEIPPLAKRRAFAQSLDPERTSDVLKKIDEEEDICDLEGMAAAKNVATFAIRGSW